MERKGTGDVRFSDTIGRTVTIRQVARDSWEVRQRFLGKDADNAQNPTWIRIDNPGPRRKLEVALLWADTEWPHWRYFAYQKIGEQYSAVHGEAAAERTTYRVEAPDGVSWFGAFPWYTNEDTDAFLKRMASHALCRPRIIGKTAQGRPLHCLTIGHDAGEHRNVVVLARTHATEAAGSYAVEGIAEFLLNGRPGKDLLRRYVFHLFPNVNPDGVAAGLKLTRLGPANECDMAVAAMSSPDPTMVALRAEVRRLRPACLMDYHSYLQTVPAAFFLDHRLGLAALRELLRGRKDEVALYFRTLLPDAGMYRVNTLWSHCHRRYRATVAVFELSWNFGLLPADVSRAGVDMFRAVMRAQAQR